MLRTIQGPRGKQKGRFRGLSAVLLALSVYEQRFAVAVGTTVVVATGVEVSVAVPVFVAVAVAVVTQAVTL